MGQQISHSPLPTSPHCSLFGMPFARDQNGAFYEYRLPIGRRFVEHSGQEDQRYVGEMSRMSRRPYLSCHGAPLNGSFGQTSMKWKCQWAMPLLDARICMRVFGSYSRYQLLFRLPFYFHETLTFIFEGMDLLMQEGFDKTRKPWHKKNSGSKESLYWSKWSTTVQIEFKS